jgi:hypothetical protein
MLSIVMLNVASLNVDLPSNIYAKNYIYYLLNVVMLIVIMLRIVML